MFTAYVFQKQQLVSGEHANVLCAYGSLPFASGQQRAIETAPASAGNPLWAPPSFRNGAQRDTNRLAGLLGLNDLLTPDPAPICAGVSGGISLYPGKKRGFRGGLGVAPALAAGTIGVGGAIGALAAILQNALDDDWTDKSVFASHAKQIHGSMLAIQCVLGGAREEIRSLDTAGAFSADNSNVICKAGTKPSCQVSDAVLAEWRNLRDGFSQFWADVADGWSITNAQASELKNYARRFLSFYQRLQPLCGSLPYVDAQGLVPPPEPKEDAPGWLKWTVGGVAVLGAVVIVRTFWGK